MIARRVAKNDVLGGLCASELDKINTRGVNNNKKRENIKNKYEMLTLLSTKIVFFLLQYFFPLHV